MGEEVIALSRSTQGHDLEKKRSQLFGISALGVPSTPTQPLALDVHQATLNQDLRPQLPQDAHEVRIAVYGGAGGRQAVFGEREQESAQMCGSFRHLGGSVNHCEAFSVHNGKDSFALVQKRSVQNEVSMC